MCFTKLIVSGCQQPIEEGEATEEASEHAWNCKENYKLEAFVANDRCCIPSKSKRKKKGHIYEVVRSSTEDF